MTSDKYNYLIVFYFRNYLAVQREMTTFAKYF